MTSGQIPSPIATSTTQLDRPASRTRITPETQRRNIVPEIATTLTASLISHPLPASQPESTTSTARKPARNRRSTVAIAQCGTSALLDTRLAPAIFPCKYTVYDLLGPLIFRHLQNNRNFGSYRRSMQSTDKKACTVSIFSICFCFKKLRKIFKAVLKKLNFCQKMLLNESFRMTPYTRF